MDDDWSEFLTQILQRLLPLVSTTLLLLLSYMPYFPLTFHPDVAVICVYYWLLNRSDVFNLFSVFLVGIINDFVSAVPLGASVFELLFLFVLVSNFLKYFNGKPFEVMWCGFMPAAFLSMLAKWFILSVYYSQFLPVVMLLFSILITIAFYPLICLINVFVQNNLMTDER